MALLWVIGLMLMFGGPMLLPVGIGAWAYNASAARERVRNWLLIFAILIVPTVAAAIWSMLSSIEGRVSDPELVVTAYVVEMALGCFGVGIGCGYVTKSWKWVGWIISTIVLLFLTLTATALGMMLALVAQSHTTCCF